MTDAKHTPEPWYYVTGKTGLHHVETHIDNPHGAGVPVCSIPKSREADAARIVACVNALRGLDVAKVEALLEAVRAWAVNCDDESMMRSMEAEQALADSIRAGGGQ